MYRAICFSKLVNLTAREYNIILYEVLFLYTVIYNPFEYQKNNTFQRIINYLQNELLCKCLLINTNFLVEIADRYS